MVFALLLLSFATGNQNPALTRNQELRLWHFPIPQSAGPKRPAKPIHFPMMPAFHLLFHPRVEKPGTSAITGEENKSESPWVAIKIILHLLGNSRPAQRFLLPHSSDLKKRISENTLNQALKRMGYKDRLSGHGIRGTISTALHEIGYPKT